jgi:plastocyanin
MKLVFLAVLAAAGMAVGASTAVSIDNYAFKAATITVPAGASVVWKNGDDDPHTVTADDGSFDSKGLANGDTYRHKFVRAGRYAYHCALHPFMHGVVIVTEATK